MEILKLAELIETPWRNGGGVTRGIATGVVSDRVAWTISRADVARDGAFSDFSGMERVLTVVSGGAMRLEGPDVAFDAVPWVPVRFDGGLPIVARLRDGPLTDLNLMFDPTLCSGDVVTRRGPGGQGAFCPQRGLLAYHVLSGAPQVGARALGVGDGHQVVIYDGAGLFSAARVWWLFRLMGQLNVAVLDGGLPKWKAEEHRAYQKRS